LVIFFVLPADNLASRNISEGLESSITTPTNFTEAYQIIVKSKFLRGKWLGACEYDISDPKQIMFMVKVDKNANSYQISCLKGSAYSPIELSDVEYDWDSCFDPSIDNSVLAKKVYDELHFRPYPLVHLTGLLPVRDTETAYVFVTNCHYLVPERVTEEHRSYCEQHDMSECNAKSAVYAVLDANDNRVYW